MTTTVGLENPVIVRGFAKFDGAPTPVTTTLWSGGIERRYRILAPTVPGNPKLPMLITLHGWGFGPEATIAVGGWDDFALAEGFISVLPEGVGLSWNGGSCCPPATDLGIDDVKFISDLIDDVAANYRLDRARVYAQGISNGGGLAYRLACELSDRIAAVGSISGSMGSPCTPGRPVPVIAIHGTADLLVPYNGGINPLFGNLIPSEAQMNAFWADNNSCSDDQHTTFVGVDTTCVQRTACKAGARVELCTVNGGGHNWPGAAIDLYQLEPVQNWWWGYQTNEIAAHAVVWNFVKNYRLPVR
jgi:polyhydroxybutyrate depolymerase